jgi:hypothetical protein
LLNYWRRFSTHEKHGLTCVFLLGQMYRKEEIIVGWTRLLVTRENVF